MPSLKLDKISLKSDDIHLWFSQPQLIQRQDLLDRYKLLLTSAELEKQQRYHFEKDRHNALITRAFVRDLLSQYVGIKPAELRFDKGPHDKPEIINSPLPLRFNLSHTSDMIICVVTLDDDIGCDVEHINRGGNLLALVDSYFSSSETAELLSLPEEQQISRFFDYWTLKESYIKACGQGLAIPLADFSFHISGTVSVQLVDKIKLSFAQHRIDQPEIWRSWLWRHNQHRIAWSIKAGTDNQSRAYKIRYFNSIPLLNIEEMSAIC